MRKLSLILIAVIVGIILFLMVFKQIIFWPLFPLLFLDAFFWYWITYHISTKKVKDLINKEEFLLIKCKRPVKNNTEIENGALVFTSDEILFVTRGDWKGKCKVNYSNQTNLLNSYEIENNSSNKETISLYFSNEKDKQEFISNHFKKEKANINKILKWN